MSDKLFDLTLEASEDFSKVPQLFELLKEEGYFKPTENETQKTAWEYCNTSLAKYYSDISDKERKNRFYYDLQYWSDRWSFSRAFTAKYIWNNVLDQGKL